MLRDSLKIIWAFPRLGVVGLSAISFLLGSTKPASVPPSHQKAYPHKTSTSQGPAKKDAAAIPNAGLSAIGSARQTVSAIRKIRWPLRDSLKICDWSQ